MSDPCGPYSNGVVDLFIEGLKEITVGGGGNRATKAESEISGFAKGTEEAGRAKNKLKPDPNATGDHTTVNRDASTGEVKNYETFKKQTNPKNPNPWETEKRYDGKGDDGHFNKVTKERVPNPHVHDPATPGGIRPPEPWEIP